MGPEGQPLDHFFILDIAGYLPYEKHKKDTYDRGFEPLTSFSIKPTEKLQYQRANMIFAYKSPRQC